MASRASNRVDSKIPAWTILQDRLDFDTEASDPTAENAVRIAPVLMMPSPYNTLFATQPPQGQGPASFLVSVVIHILAGAMVWFSLLYKPPFTRVTEAHYTVRHLDLRSPDEQRAAEAARIRYPNQHPGKSTAAGQKQPAPPLPRPTIKAQPGPQTLIQADLLNPAKMPLQIPVPQVVIWTPTKTTAKTIVPPTPEKPTAADALPVLEPPNQELNLSDVNIASSNLPSFKLPVAPSSTSPVTIHQPQQVQLPPASASQQTAPPTPAAILSLSDIRLKDGTAALPPVSESPVSKVKSTLPPGTAQNPSAQAGNGAPANKPGENGAGQNAQTPADHPGPSPAAGKTETTSLAPANETTPNAMSGFTSTPIALPKDGHFGAVIAGESLEQQFPEITDAWGGRLAYTAYLHVGLAKSWIMQYSLPANAEAAAGGMVSQLEAPWPYSIVRPNLAPGSIDADALMVRGFVDQSGRFEDLSIVFPQPFASGQFVLTALQQWQFRPATQGGQAVRVEVLLIIPETLE